MGLGTQISSAAWPLVPRTIRATRSQSPGQVLGHALCLQRPRPRGFRGAVSCDRGTCGAQQLLSPRVATAMSTSPGAVINRCQPPGAALAYLWAR